MTDAGGGGDDPLVSVVIPSVRGGPLLAEAVASVAAQSEPSLEILVVRNAPGVDLGPVPADPRLRVLDEPIAGRAYAVNRGALEARGRWLALLDDDDTWATKKLEAQLAALEDWDGVAASVTDFQRVDEHGGFLKAGVSRPATYLDLLAVRTTYLPSTLLVDRRLFEVLGGFNPAILTADDLDFFLRLAALGPICFVPGAHMHYRVHQQTMTQATRRLMWLEGARVIASARRGAVSRGDWAAWRASWRGTVNFRRFCTSDALAYAERALRAGDRRTAAGLVATAVRASPYDVARLALKRLAGRI